MSNNDNRNRYLEFFTECYQETFNTIADVEQRVKNLCPIKYAIILHDKDVNECNELKKAHYHIYMFFDKRRDVNVIAKAFNLTDAQVQKCNNMPYAIKYLVHTHSNYRLKIYKYEFVALSRQE